MKTLSVKQPWAYLICAGIKDIENRTWPCPKKYIGERVLIHAGRSTTKRGRFNYSMFSDLQLDEIEKAKYERNLNQLYLNGYYYPRYLYIANDVSSYSAITGSVEIVDCVINHPSIWAEKTHYDEFEDTKPIYNWVFAKPILFDKPILNVKGKLGFWDNNFDEIICHECNQIEFR